MDPVSPIPFSQRPGDYWPSDSHAPTSVRLPGGDPTVRAQEDVSAWAAQNYYLGQEASYLDYYGHHYRMKDDPGRYMAERERRQHYYMRPAAVPNPGYHLHRPHSSDALPRRRTGHLADPQTQLQQTSQHEWYDHMGRYTNQPGRPSGLQQEVTRPQPAPLQYRAPPRPTPVQHQAPLRVRPPVDDTTFHDADDFQLFAQATYGLSPERPQWNSSLDSVVQAEAHDDRDDWPPQTDMPVGAQSSGDIPRTLYALAQHAQAPQSTPDLNRSHRASWEPPRQTSYFHNDPAYWDDPPLPRRTNTFDAISPSADDELPDYAQSQAEAEARARRQAMLRAQELQRKWKECRG